MVKKKGTIYFREFDKLWFIAGWGVSFSTKAAAMKYKKMTFQINTLSAKLSSTKRQRDSIKHF